MTPLLSLSLHRVAAYDTREGWERGRIGNHRIGASIVSRILTAPWEALETLTGEAAPHDAATLRAFARGHRWEAMVLAEYAATKNVVALDAGSAYGFPGSLVIVSHPAHEWACCSPDAVTVDPDLGPGLVECKTDAGGMGWAEEDCTLRTAADYHSGLAPSGYVTQAYWQMAVTGVPFCDLVCLLPRYALRIVRVLADPDTHADLLSTVGEWRERHLVRGEPLPVDGSEACTRALTRRFPGATGKDLRAATAHEAAMVRRYAGVKAEIKRLEADADQLRNEIAEGLGDAYGLSLGGKEKALLIPTKGRTTVSLADIAANSPAIFSALEKGAFINTGASYRQLRCYGLE